MTPMVVLARIGSGIRPGSFGPGLITHLTPDWDLCYSTLSAIYNFITKNAPTKGGGTSVATKVQTWWQADAMNRDRLSITYWYFIPDAHEKTTHPIRLKVGFSVFAH